MTYATCLAITAESALSTADICYRQSRKDIGKIYRAATSPRVVETVQFMGTLLYRLAEICYLAGRASRTSMEAFLLSCMGEPSNGISTDGDVLGSVNGSSVGTERTDVRDVAGADSSEPISTDRVEPGSRNGGFSKATLAAAREWARYCYGVPSDVSFSFINDEMTRFWVEASTLPDRFPDGSGECVHDLFRSGDKYPRQSWHTYRAALFKYREETERRYGPMRLD